MSPEQTAVEPKRYAVVKMKSVRDDLDDPAITVRLEKYEIVGMLDENPFPGAHFEKITVDETTCLVTRIVESSSKTKYLLTYMLDEKNAGRITVTAIKKKINPAGG